jgi:hypothetical protein
MWPQRKPFVVEIKKNKRLRSKSPSTQTSGEIPAGKKGASVAPVLTLQREDRS